MYIQKGEKVVLIVDRDSYVDDVRRTTPRFSYYDLNDYVALVGAELVGAFYHSGTVEEFTKTAPVRSMWKNRGYVWVSTLVDEAENTDLPHQPPEKVEVRWGQTLSATALEQAADHVMFFTNDATFKEFMGALTSRNEHMRISIVSALAQKEGVALAQDLGVSPHRWIQINDLATEVTRVVNAAKS